MPTKEEITRAQEFLGLRTKDSPTAKAVNKEPVVQPVKTKPQHQQYRPLPPRTPLRPPNFARSS